MRHDVADWDPMNDYGNCAQLEAKILELGRQFRYGCALYYHFAPRLQPCEPKDLSPIEERYASIASVAMLTPAEKCWAMVKMIKGKRL